MADAVRPEVERRQKDSGMFRHVAETLIGKQSRKVAFGIWGFIVGNSLLVAAKIDSHQWLIWSLTMAGLVGFGTIMDELLRKFGNKLVGAAADKVNAVITSKTQTVEKTESVAVQQ